MDIAELLRGIMAPAVAGGGGPPAPPAQLQPEGTSPTSMGVPAAMGAPPSPPAPAPGQPAAPPDLSTLYTKLLDQQRSDKYVDGGAAMIAAGFAQPQNRAALISGAFGAGNSGSNNVSSTLTSLLALQKDAAAKQSQALMRTRLPALAKQYGLDMDTINFLFESGKLDETINKLADPNTEVVKRADGSTMLLDKRSGKVKSEVAPADPLYGKELRNTPDGGTVEVNRIAGNAATPILPGNPNFGRSGDLKDLDEVNAERAKSGQEPITKEKWLESQAANKASKTQVSLGETLEKDTGKIRIKGLMEQATKVKDGIQVIDKINNARDTLDRGVITGSLMAEPAKEARKVFAQAFGFNDEAANNTDVFRAQMKEIVLPRVKALGTGNSISNADVKFIEDAVGASSTITAEAAREILRIMEKGERNEAAKHGRDVEEFGKIKDSKGELAFETASKLIPRPKLPPPRAKPETIERLRKDFANGDVGVIKEFDDYFGSGSAAHFLGQ